MEVDFGGDFLTIETSEDGDTFSFLNEGEKVPLTFQGKTKDVINFKVRNTRTKKELIYTPGYKQGRLLQEAFGKETKNWIGREFQVIHIEDKMLIRPLKQTITTEKV